LYFDPVYQEKIGKDSKIKNFLRSIIVGTLEGYDDRALNEYKNIPHDSSGTLNSVIDSSIATLIKNKKDSIEYL
jgi:hypothetical protein